MSEIADWQLSASIANLLKRRKLSVILGVFSLIGVLEVETPMMSQAYPLPIFISSPFETQFVGACASSRAKVIFNEFSPEYHMKRPLAANSK